MLCARLLRLLLVIFWWCFRFSLLLESLCSLHFESLLCTHNLWLNIERTASGLVVAFEQMIIVLKTTPERQREISWCETGETLAFPRYDILASPIPSYPVQPCPASLCHPAIPHCQFLMAHLGNLSQFGISRHIENLTSLINGHSGFSSQGIASRGFCTSSSCSATTLSSVWKRVWVCSEIKCGIQELTYWLRLVYMQPQRLDQPRFQPTPESEQWDVQTGKSRIMSQNM